MSLLTEIKRAAAAGVPVIIRTKGGFIYGPNGNTVIGRVNAHKGGGTITLMDRKGKFDKVVLNLKNVESVQAHG